MDDLLKQLHLMSKDDIICVLLVQACNKVIKLYCLNGMLMYFTEKETNRKAMSWSGNDFKRFADATDKINQPYDEAYISVLFFEDTPYFIEHNEPLSNDEVGTMVGFVSTTSSAGGLPSYALAKSYERSELTTYQVRVTQK